MFDSLSGCRSLKQIRILIHLTLNTDKALDPERKYVKHAQCNYLASTELQFASLMG